MSAETPGYAVPLAPELKAYLADGPLPGTQELRHPLVYQVPFFPALAYQSNSTLVWKRKALTQAMAAGDWHHAVWLHERPHRITALDQIASRVTPDEAYWKLLSDTYADAECFWQEPACWRRLLTSDRPGRSHFTGVEDRAAFARLPAELSIYRGFNGRGRQHGWAWTLSKDRAEWFAHHLAEASRGRPPTVASATARKRDVIGYLSWRDKREIVIEPRNLVIVKAEIINGS